MILATVASSDRPKLGRPSQVPPFSLLPDEWASGPWGQEWLGWACQAEACQGFSGGRRSAAKTRENACKVVPTFQLFPFQPSSELSSCCSISSLDVQPKIIPCGEKSRALSHRGRRKQTCRCMSFQTLLDVCVWIELPSLPTAYLARITSQT